MREVWLSEWVQIAAGGPASTAWPPGNYAEAWQTHGWDVTWLTSEELHRNEPLLNPAITAALYVPYATSIRPRLATRAYTEAARKLGARIYEHTEVTGIHHTSGAMTGIRTARGETIDCDLLVIATGA
ncbi:hypothetical protein KSC_016540 [Ktedonobacter sp. SOSP1-52]|nr:hypothetical protein KSC_016540 [Ktedonobacter sp. SOSP1-52]